MKWPLETPSLTALHAVIGLGLVGSFLGCFASVTSAARDTFVHDHSCPADQVTVRTGDPGSIEVLGCGHDDQYLCVPGGNDPVSGGSSPTHCVPRQRFAFEATDGSLNEAWDWGADRDAAAREAAIASAVHDLPCPRASVVAADALTLEGCGQRITYRQVDLGIATPPGHFRITNGARYMLVGRIPIPGTGSSSAPASGSSGQPPSPAPSAR